MTTLNKIQFALVATFVAFSIFAITTEPLVVPEYSLDFVAYSDDEALAACEALGLVLNYESEGLTAFEFCDAPEGAVMADD